MKIGELFIQLGVKGSKGAARSLKDIGSGLAQVKKKALIVVGVLTGITVALKRLAMKSQGTAASLRDFQDLTGTSAIALQKWQYAGIKAGATADGVKNSFYNLSKALRAHRAGESPIKGFGTLAANVNLSNTKLTDTLGMMRKLNEFATKDFAGRFTAVEITDWLQSFGLTDDVIAAMKRGAFTTEKMKGARLYDANKIKKLSSYRDRWADLGDRWEKTIAKLTNTAAPTLLKAAEIFLKATDMWIGGLSKINTGFLMKNLKPTASNYNIFNYGGSSRYDRSRSSPYILNEELKKQIEKARSQNKSNLRDQ